VSALLLDDASKPATPLTNGAINQTLRHFAPLSDNDFLQLVDYRESSTLISHLLKGIPNSIFLAHPVGVWLYIEKVHLATGSQ